MNPAVNQKWVNIWGTCPWAARCTYPPIFSMEGIRSRREERILSRPSQAKKARGSITRPIAIPLPIPLLAPVTRQTLPSIPEKAQIFSPLTKPMSEAATTSAKRQLCMRLRSPCRGSCSLECQDRDDELDRHGHCRFPEGENTVPEQCGGGTYVLRPT